MTIYLDVVFIENVLMNYIILYATSIALKERSKTIRTIISSTIGAIYTILMYINIIPIYSNIYMKILLSISMIYIAFYPRTIKALIKQIIFFYLISFVFGGCTIALMYMLKPQMVKIKNGALMGLYPIKITIIAGIVAFIIVQISFRMIKSRITKKNILYNLKIYLNKKSITIKALLDTGNMLKDPITQIPVIVVEKQSLSPIISQETIENIKTMLKCSIPEKTTNVEQEYINKIRVIPFSSLGMENGMLIGIKADKVEIIVEGKSQRIQDAIIGIYDKELSRSHSYSAIVGLEALQG